jgi:hypothetical protein
MYPDYCTVVESVTPQDRVHAVKVQAGQPEPTAMCGWDYAAIQASPSLYNNWDTSVLENRHLECDLAIAAEKN